MERRRDRGKQERKDKGMERMEGGALSFPIDILPSALYDFGVLFSSVLFACLQKCMTIDT
jgi:hypothetical protein